MTTPFKLEKSMGGKSPRALLVIDMQLGLFSARQPRYQSASVIANINRLIDTPVTCRAYPLSLFNMTALSAMNLNPTLQAGIFCPICTVPRQRNAFARQPVTASTVQGCNSCCIHLEPKH